MSRFSLMIYEWIFLMSLTDSLKRSNSKDSFMNQTSAHTVEMMVLSYCCNNSLHSCSWQLFSFGFLNQRHAQILQLKDHTLQKGLSRVRPVLWQLFKKTKFFRSQYTQLLSLDYHYYSTVISCIKIKKLHYSNNVEFFWFWQKSQCKYKVIFEFWELNMTWTCFNGFH